MITLGDDPVVEPPVEESVYDVRLRERKLRQQKIRAAMVSRRDDGQPLRVEKLTSVEPIGRAR